MEIEVTEKNGYRIMRIKEDITVDSDLSPLKQTFNSQLELGAKNLAVSFSPGSIFYSNTIAVLVQFLGFVKERNGNFAVIHPIDKKLQSLALIGLDKLMNLQTSEEKVGLL